jgi:hypothetical protein
MHVAKTLKFLVGLMAADIRIPGIPRYKKLHDRKRSRAQSPIDRAVQNLPGRQIRGKL